MSTIKLLPADSGQINDVLNILNLTLSLMMEQSQKDCDERHEQLVGGTDGPVERVDYRVESDIDLYTDHVFHVATWWDGSSQDVRIKRYQQIKLCESRGVKMATLIHPTATVTEGTVIGRGTYIDEICHVSINSVIGPYCAITTGAVIGHDTTLGFNCQISLQATLSMQTVGHNTSIGAYAKIMNWKNKNTRNRMIHIGSNCKIFSGVAMSKDIPDGHMQITNNRVWRSKEAPQDELC